MKDQIRIDTAEFNIFAADNAFHVDDKRDVENYPVIMTPSKRPKRNIKAFYNWVTRHQDKIRSKEYKFTDLCRDLHDDGIEYHYFCSMD